MQPIYSDLRNYYDHTTCNLIKVPYSGKFSRGLFFADRQSLLLIFAGLILQMGMIMPIISCNIILILRVYFLQLVNYLQKKHSILGYSCSFFF